METLPATRRAPRLALRLLLVALIAALAGGGVYFQGWYANCHRPNAPGGEACNISIGLGFFFCVALTLVVFLTGLIIVLILQWIYRRSIRRVV